MARKININTAFEEGNKKLFKENKSTYTSIFGIGKRISEETGISIEIVSATLKRWRSGESGINLKHENSNKIFQSFFKLLGLNSEDYYTESEV